MMKNVISLGFWASAALLAAAFASRACRSAIMFGDALTRDECEAVVATLARCNDPFHCAHGRPTLTVLAKLF